MCIYRDIDLFLYISGISTVYVCGGGVGVFARGSDSAAFFEIFKKITSLKSLA